MEGNIMNREDLIIEKVGDPMFDLDKLAEDMGSPTFSIIKSSLFIILPSIS